MRLFVNKGPFTQSFGVSVSVSGDANANGPFTQSVSVGVTF